MTTTEDPGTTARVPAANLVCYHWVMTLQGPAAGTGGWVTKMITRPSGAADLPAREPEPAAGPAEAEQGHARECERFAATVAAWEEQWGDE